MGQFTIESLQPIGGNYWKAVVSVSDVEDQQGRSFGFNNVLTFRFKYHHEGSALGLLQHTLDEARRFQTASSAILLDAGVALE